MVPNKLKKVLFCLPINILPLNIGLGIPNKKMMHYHRLTGNSRQKWQSSTVNLNVVNTF